MNGMIMTWVFTFIRKFVFGASMTWLIELFRTAGATDADIDKWIQIAIAGALMAVAALWTAVSDWIKKRNAAKIVAVPK